MSKSKPIAYNTGTLIHLMEIDANALQEKLEPQIYQLESTDKTPILRPYLKQFKLPNRIYGTVIHTRKKLILDTFERNRKPLGAMGIGQKGTGKTEQMQLICNAAVAMGIPVLMIRKPCRREDIELAIRYCKKCIVFFDEYGKVYQDHEENSEQLRNELLTMFSDTSLGHVLFLLTDNTTRNFNDFILERPTRIRYRFDYVGCSSDIVLDIAKTYKLSKEITEWLLNHAKGTEESIDGILTICNEGRNAKSLEEFIEVFSVLNVIKPKYDRVDVRSTSDKVTAEVRGKEVIIRGPDIEDRFTIGKHPLVGQHKSHTYSHGELKIEIFVQQQVNDPGENYTVSVGKAYATLNRPWNSF